MYILYICLGGRNSLLFIIVLSFSLSSGSNKTFKQRLRPMSESVLTYFNILAIMSANQSNNANNNYQAKQKKVVMIADDKAGKKKETDGFSSKAMKPKVEKELLKYARRLVDPLDCELGLSPSPVPNRMVAIRDKIVIDLKEHLSGTGDWFVEVRPKLTDTVTLTAGITSSVGATNNIMYTVGFINGKLRGGILVYGGGARNSIDFQEADASPAGGGFLLSDSGAAKVYSITWDPTEFSGDVQGTLEVYVAATIDDLGNSAAIYSVAVNQATTGVLPGSFTLPANTVCIGFKFVTAQLSVVRGNFSMLYASGAGSHLLGNSISTMITLDTEFSKASIDYDRYRITAQDALITYMGSDFSNGGVIASARVPDTWSPSGNYYDAITQLPYDSYNGPLKVGTHIHWLPASVQELTPNGYGDVPGSSNKIIAYGRQDDLVNKQSVRLIVTTVIEFYSDVPIYGAMKFCPPPTNLGLLIYWMGVNIPAATSNEDHFDKLKKFLPTALSKGLQYGIDNPEIVTRMLRLALGLFI